MINVEAEVRNVTDDIDQFDPSNKIFQRKYAWSERFPNYANQLRYNVYSRSVLGRFLNFFTRKITSFFHMTLVDVLHTKYAVDAEISERMHSHEKLLNELMKTADKLVQRAGKTSSQSNNELEKTIYEQIDAVNQKIDTSVHIINKMVDGFKNEVLVEINRGRTGEGTAKIETKILNQQRIDSLSEKKLNLGCGRDIREEFINVDYRELEGVDVVADVADLPFDKGSIDSILASHLVEHFTERQLTELLQHWYSLLKDSGQIIIMAPNMQAMINDYNEKKIGWDQLRRISLGAQDYIGDFHYNFLSPEYITELIHKTLKSAEVKLEVEDRVKGDCKEFEIHIIKTS